MPEKLKHFFAKKLAWVSCLLIILLSLTLTALWPLLCRLIPPTKHTGVELFESSVYLNFEKGALFGEQISQFPFSQEAVVLSFEYYDFRIRDAIFQDDPFPDVYLVQLDLGEAYNEARRYLDERAYDIEGSLDGHHRIYYLGGPEDTDCFYVAINDQRQEVFCFLVTDRSTWACVDIFFSQNLGWVPGM